MLTTTPLSPLYEHRGITLPTFLYGTAWKEDQTESLVQVALSAGFRGIDTANQRRHYHEAGVGQALKNLFDKALIQRSELFLQTKFTYISSQDHRLPYDPNASFTEQVEQSFTRSLEHLGTSYIDSYILHGPASRYALTATDWEVWRAMEQLKKSNRVRLLGVSNIEFDQLQLLLEGAEIKPAFVQNRCFAHTQWDARIRKLCRANDILYQGFSLLTANSTEINHPIIHKIAQRLECSVAQVIFRFALQNGMIPLTGTTNNMHMKNDLDAYSLMLTEAEMETIENIAMR
ncbi:MAG: aldo/keto reductase [Pseudomonadota bacterium]